jgi:hypothetical protein
MRSMGKDYFRGAPLRLPAAGKGFKTGRPHLPAGRQGEPPLQNHWAIFMTHGWIMFDGQFIWILEFGIG